jgi:hypothetical protein
MSRRSKAELALFRTSRLHVFESLHNRSRYLRLSLVRRQRNSRNKCVAGRIVHEMSELPAGTYFKIDSLRRDRTIESQPFFPVY